MSVRVNFHELIEKSVHYLLIYLLWLISGSQIGNLDVGILYAACIGLSAWFFITNKVVPTRELIVLSIFSMGCIFLVRLINHGGLGLGACITFILNLYIPYLVYQFNEERFVERFINFTVVFCIISLCFFVLGKFNYAFTRSLFLTEQQVNRWVVYSGKFLYVLRNSELGRNNGIFTEPGLFQIPINTAVFFLLFYKSKIQFSNLKKIIAFLILAVTLVTVQSTTGYLAFGLILAVWVITRDNVKYILKSNLILIFCGVLAVIAYFVVSGENNLIVQVLFRKLAGIFVSGESGSYRMTAITAFFDKIWWQYPLGSGYDNYQAILKTYGVNSAGYALSTGAGFFSLIAIYGTPLMLTVYYWIVRQAYQNRKHIILVLLFIMLYLNTALAQSTCIYGTMLIIAYVNGREVGEKNGKETVCINHNSML